MDYSETRRTMVDCQLMPENIHSPRVISAFLDIPREVFFPRQQQSIAYADDNFSLGYGRYILRPATLAKLIQALDPQPHEKALILGCNAGYSVAVLDQLVHVVIGVEAEEQLSKQAEKSLNRIGARNFEVVQGDPTKGCVQYAPYDVILIDGKIEVEPVDVFGQLKENGRLVAITSCPGLADEVTLYTNVNNCISKQPVCDASAPILKGFELGETFEF